jgi:iron complex outermembrane receptor protein
MKLFIQTCLLIIPYTLQAQQDTSRNRIDSLAEVVVTGVSRAIFIRENPIAIVSVPARSIDRAVEANIIDALVKNVPGLSAVKTGPNISKPFIRGLGYNRVLTLYDGMRQEGQQWGDEHGIEVDAYNIGKAEVIKGPASLLFGSDAVAGVVSLFPWLPVSKDGKVHGRLLSEYQGNNGLVGNGIRLGAANEHWLWALKGSWRLAKNYTNAIDGRVYNTGFRETNAAASVGYTSTKGSTTLNATLYDNLQGIPDGSRDSLTRRFTRQIYEGDQDDIRNRPAVPASDLNSYSLSPLHQHIQHYRLYTNTHYSLGKGEIDGALGLQQSIRRDSSHPTLPQQAGLFLQLNTLNYGIRYLLPTFSRIELTAGINGMLQYNKSKQATDFPIPDYTLQDLGGYLHGKWKQGPLILSGGLRYDTRQLQGRDTSTLNKTFHGISLSAGATYQLSRSISLKANLARGYRSPSITELASKGLDPGAHITYLGNRSFNPEFSLQQDLGISGSFPDLGFSCSLFNNNIRHYIYLSQLVDAGGNPIVDAQGNKTFQYQQSEAGLYGAEASLNIHPTAWPGFSFDNQFAVTYGVNKKNSYSGKGIRGEYLPLIPPARWATSIGQEITRPTGLFSSFSVKGEWEYNAAQHRYLALYNTETPTPSYTLINISAGASLRCANNQLLQFQVQVNNLMDIAYQNNLSRLKYFEYYAASPGNHLGIYNMGRNICMKMIYEF